MGFKEFCHVNKPLLPLKVLMFLIHGGIAALLPYMAIHMKSLGITLTETAIILTVLPFVSAIGPPIGGALADKLGNYKLVFIVSVVVSIFLHILLYAVTPAYIASRPLNLTFRVSESDNGLGMNCIDPGNLTFKGLESITNLCHPNPFSFKQKNLWLQSCRSSDCAIGLNETCSNFNSSFTSCLNYVNDTCGHSSIGCNVNCVILPQSEINCLSAFERTNITGDRVSTLAIYNTLRLTSTTILWMAVPLLDALAVTMSKEFSGDLGWQRMFSQLGFALLPPLSGALITVASNLNNFEDYGPAFYILAVTHALAAILVFFMRVNLRMPAQNLRKNIKKVMGDRRVISLTLVIFVLGCGFGSLTGFLFWYMEETLKSSKLMCGLSQTSAGIFGIIAMACSTPIIRRVGHINIFGAGLFGYALRFLALSYIPEDQAYWVLPLQILEAVSHSLVIVTAADYAGKLSPKYVATLQGVTFAMHYSCGKGGGSFFAGLLMNVFGSRGAFRIFAVAYAIFGTLYLLLEYFCVTKYRKVRFVDGTNNTPIVITPQQVKLLGPNVSAVSEYKPPNYSIDDEGEETTFDGTDSLNHLGNNIRDVGKDLTLDLEEDGPKKMSSFNRRSLTPPNSPVSLPHTEDEAKLIPGPKGDELRTRPPIAVPDSDNDEDPAPEKKQKTTTIR